MPTSRFVRYTPRTFPTRLAVGASLARYLAGAASLHEVDCGWEATLPGEPSDPSDLARGEGLDAQRRFSVRYGPDARTPYVEVVTGAQDALTCAVAEGFVLFATQRWRGQRLPR